MTVNDLPSFHNDYLDTTSDSPINFKKPKVLLKRKNPIIDISSVSASKTSKKSNAKSKSKSQKLPKSKESVNIDECNILQKSRRG